jgi:D-lactate dehydrogenase
MKVRVYSSYNFIIPYLEKANQGKHELFFEKEALTLETAEKANGFDAISISLLMMLLKMYL